MTEFQQPTREQASRRMFILIMVVVWFAALIISPYYIAKSKLDNIAMQKRMYLESHHVQTASNDPVIKAYTKESMQYTAGVYIIFGAIWIILPLIGIRVALAKNKRRKERH